METISTKLSSLWKTLVVVFAAILPGVAFRRNIEA